VDLTRLLYGTRNPLLIGGLLGFWMGALASMVVLALYALLFRFEIGNLTPLVAMAFGIPIGVVVGITVAVAIRRLGG
jgi:hypothetical protein